MANIDLPDPTIDLDWGGFKGSIQDIFEANAKKFPSRTCIVETQSETTKAREFTYAQINEVSNVLAHFLVARGVKHGEVCMIYAYRGVDLAVGIIGVLKAGATFSVLDPLYPPDRQRIYLEVAQPKALINIKKATLDAGELSTTVRNYIDDSLSLKAEVPALFLDDDGTLYGGEEEELDLFEQFQSKKTNSPGILVGPDSNPTLSFVSFEFSLPAHCLA